MTDAANLLARARTLLASKGSGGLSLRMTAFLARQALEEIIAERCARLRAPAPWSPMRTKLLILRALDDPHDADLAAMAWNRLSNACHVHAYEMQPSVSEVEHLCSLVESLSASDHDA
jgi:hypothetical protein